MIEEQHGRLQSGCLGGATIATRPPGCSCRHAAALSWPSLSVTARGHTSRAALTTKRCIAFALQEARRRQVARSEALERDRHHDVAAARQRGQARNRQPRRERALAAGDVPHPHPIRHAALWWFTPPLLRTLTVSAGARLTSPRDVQLEKIRANIATPKRWRRSRARRARRALGQAGAVPQGDHAHRRCACGTLLVDQGESYTEGRGLEDPLKAVGDAIEEVRQCRALKPLLSVLLCLGNHMNGGAPKGQADGLALEPLQDVGHQDLDNKASLLEYAVTLLHASRVERRARAPRSATNCRTSRRRARSSGPTCFRGAGPARGRRQGARAQPFLVSPRRTARAATRARRPAARPAPTHSRR